MPYRDGSPTLGEQIADHMEMKREAEEMHKIWNEAYACGQTEMKAQCVEIAEAHANFCDQEARSGGHSSLFERAKGAAHIAQKIRES